MPGSVTAGVPDSIPLQVIQQSGGFCNGDSSGAAEGSAPLAASGLHCKECKGTSKSPRACGGCWQIWYCSRAHQISNWKTHMKECKPYKIMQNDVLGRHLVATRDIKAGELLIEDPNLIMGPKLITEPVCLACYRPVDGSFCCPKCGFPMCDEGCCEAEAHEPECKAVQGSGTKVKVTMFGEVNTMYECIMPVRILALRDDSPSVWRKIINLESHIEKRLSTEIAAITQKTVVNIMINRLNLDYEPGLIQQVLGIIDTNGFEIRLPDSQIMGLYGSAAMLEHSCIPNTHRTFDADLNLVMRAAITIKRGEHLKACYTESLSTTSTRQEHLLTSKFFTCACERCTDPTELGTFTSAMVCPTCMKKAKKNKKPKEGETEDPNFAVVVPKFPSSPSSPWECLTCKNPLDSKCVMRMTAVMTEEAEELENSTQTVVSCEAFLEKWKPTYHKNHAACLNVSLNYISLPLYNLKYFIDYLRVGPLVWFRRWIFT